MLTSIKHNRLLALIFVRRMAGPSVKEVIKLGQFQVSLLAPSFACQASAATWAQQHNPTLACFSKTSLVFLAVRSRSSCALCTQAEPSAGCRNDKDSVYWRVPSRASPCADMLPRPGLAESLFTFLVAYCRAQAMHYSIASSSMAIKLCKQWTAKLEMLRIADT